MTSYIRVPRRTSLAAALIGVPGDTVIRYDPAPVTLTAENQAHRARQALRREPVAGRVPRTDPGYLRTLALRNDSRPGRRQFRDEVAQ